MFAFRLDHDRPSIHAPSLSLSPPLHCSTSTNKLHSATTTLPPLGDVQKQVNSEIKCIHEYLVDGSLAFVPPQPRPTPSLPLALHQHTLSTMQDWQPGQRYEVGRKVGFGNDRFMVEQAHTSRPSFAPFLPPRGAVLPLLPLLLSPQANHPPPAESFTDIRSLPGFVCCIGSDWTPDRTPALYGKVQGGQQQRSWFGLRRKERRGSGSSSSSSSSSDEEEFDQWSEHRKKKKVDLCVGLSSCGCLPVRLCAVLNTDSAQFFATPSFETDKVHFQNSRSLSVGLRRSLTVQTVISLPGLLFPAQARSPDRWRNGRPRRDGRTRHLGLQQVRRKGEEGGT